MLIIEIIKNKLKNYLFLPKIFFFLRFFKLNNSKIRPYFGINIFKTGGPYIRNRRLINIFGNFIVNPNIIYAQSYWTTIELEDAIKFSKKYRIPIVFNQNGWFYKGWYQKNWKSRNKKLIQIHKKSRFIIYQSKFCKDTSMKLNSYFSKKNKIIYNCVPKINYYQKKTNKNYFLLSGVFDQNSMHIIKPAIDAFKILDLNLNFKRKNIKLIIAGYFTKNAKSSSWYKKTEKDIQSLLSKDILEIRGKYTSKNFSQKFKDVNFALHLKYKDPCPNAVVERMHLGMVHVYSNSGGTPEIIGNSGIGINVKNTWNKQISVDPMILSKKIVEVINKKKILQKNVKKRLKFFSYNNYISQHKKIFLDLINKK